MSASERMKGKRGELGVSEPVDLSLESVEAIALRVADLLTADRTPTAPLLDAAEVARRFSVTRSYVYDNAGTLGAIRLGNGGKGARLRFNPATVAAALTANTDQPAIPAPRTPPRRRPRRADHTANGAPLLNVRERAA